jgi:hypothetical protein
MSRPLVVRWREALRDSDLDRTAKLVGYILSTFMDKDGLAWPGKETIAAGAGVHPRTADKAIKRIELFGLLGVQHSPGFRTNQYFALLQNPGAEAGVYPGAGDQRTPARGTKNPGASAPRTRELTRNLEQEPSPPPPGRGFRKSREARESEEFDRKAAELGIDLSVYDAPRASDG